MVDPRNARGIRHRLVVLLTVAVCTVSTGARSFVAVAEWVADLPATPADTLGTGGRCPSESTIRRAVGAMDADAFDAVIGGLVQQLCAAVAPAGRRRVLAVDGKTLRGSRHIDRDGNVVVGRHLLAVIDQHTRVVLGQLDVAGKTSEITAFTPLLDTLTSIDLAETVITADALHTQREHVADLHARGAHWVLSVKGNQPRLRRQLAARPWRQVEISHRAVATAHGRREIRTCKVVTIAAGIEFPHAAQAVQIIRKSRPISARTGKKSRWRTETRTGAAPQVMATLRNLAISLHRLAGAHQHRRRATTSRPRRPPTTPTTQHHLTLPTPWVGHGAADQASDHLSPLL